MEEQKSFCTFRVGTMTLGVEVHRVQEVIREQAMTRVPGANEIVRGLMNLREQIVTALDVQKRLRLDESSHNKPTMNVVIRTADELGRESANRAASMAALGLTAEQWDHALKTETVRLQETLDVYS